MIFSFITWSLRLVTGGGGDDTATLLFVDDTDFLSVDGVDGLEVS